MISKSRANFILSLGRKKEREKEGLFLIEGDKIVKEFLMANIKLRMLIAKPEFINSLDPALKENIDDIETVTFDELRKISTLKTPHNAIAVAAMPVYEPDYNEIFKGLAAALDFVQDPGNLGTIIRAAAWFGINDIFCSHNCVDVFNPKVIQATMGAVLNVRVHYCDLKKFLTEAREKEYPVYGTLLEGKSIYSHKLDTRGLILLGNESKGISADLLPFITERIMIPRFTSTVTGIDSLNVGMAASVVFSEFARRKD